MQEEAFINEIRSITGLEEKGWKDWLAFIQNRMMISFCYHSYIKSLKEEYIDQSLSIFILIYHSKLSLMGNCDVLLMKILVLLGATPKAFNFNQFLELKHSKKIEDNIRVMINILTEL